MGLKVGLSVNLTDRKAYNIKPDGKPRADGTVSGRRPHPGKVKGHGKWLMRFVSPETNKRRDRGLEFIPRRDWTHDDRVA